MLTKTLAFGLLAASTIGFAVPAGAQETQQSTQVINSTTVGVNGSHVFSGNAQSSENTIYDHDYGYGFDYEAAYFPRQSAGHWLYYGWRKWLWGRE